MRYINHLFFAFLLLISFNSVAQFDTTYNSFSSARLRVIDRDNILNDSLVWNPLDTSFSWYDFEGIDANFYDVNLGNLGSANTSLLYNIGNSSLFFGTNVYRRNLLLIDNSKYYSTTVPLTRVHFFTGPKKEQGAGFIHTQNVSQALNLTVDFSRASSEGAYINQKTKRSKFGFNANYIDPTNRYFAFVNWNINVGENLENGGLVNDSLFIENTETNRFGIAVNLNNAINKYDIREGGITQYLNLFRKASFDTNKISTDYRFRLFSSNLVRSNYHRYYDDQPDSTFYVKFAPHDSVRYDDVVKTLRFENVFGFQFSAFKSITPELGLTYNSNKYKDYLSDTNFMEFGYRIRIPEFDLNKYYGRLSVSGAIDGFNNNRFQIESEAGRVLFDDLKIGVEYVLNKSLPEFFLLQYSNRHFSWNNSEFKEELKNSYSLKLLSQKMNLAFKASLISIDNYTYYSMQGRPEQYNGGRIDLLKLRLDKKISLKPIFVELSGVYQQLKDDLPISLPELSTINKLYYQNTLFRKAIDFRLGTRVKYYTAYYGKGYFPLVRQFYYQNKVKTGNYPFLDVFLKVKIKRAQLFFEVNNMGEGIFNYEYITVPGYPMRDRNFRFGVQWDFMN